LLRTALTAALVVACGLLLIRLLVESGPDVMTFITAGQSTGTPPAGGQISLPGLESGACVAYPATTGRSTKTVFIDPGHGGIDPGVVGSVGGRPALEKDATLAVANRLSVILRADGYRVVMARTRDSSVVKLSPSDSADGSLKASAEHRDLLARTACANASRASVLISIHFDAFSDPSVGGSETFYDPARTFSAESKRLSLALQSSLVAALGTSDRGVWTDDKLSAPSLTDAARDYGHLIELGPTSPGWVDNPSLMPGALVEPLFLTNPAEAQMASDPAGQQRIAQALATGLGKYFSSA
jgi:N-acetylmuramoyl-L-alanine amidase